MTLKIDAHHHLWDLSQKKFDYGWLTDERLKPINKTYLPDALAEHLKEVGVDKTIVVQTQHMLAENDWALEQAYQTNFIAGIVGWVDLASEEVEEQIVRYQDEPKFVGVRHVVQEEPDDNFILRPDVQRGLGLLEKHHLPFDLLFYVRHLHHAKTLGEQFPALPMVINHLSKPEIKAGRMDNWADNVRAAATCPNIYCKLSGMITEADWAAWKPADLRPYVETILEAFGPGRCMFGSDWPVCELAGTYQQVYNALSEIIGPLSESENDQIFGKTASKFYRLGTT